MIPLKESVLGKLEIYSWKDHLVIISVSEFILLVYVWILIVNSCDILKCWNMERMWKFPVEIFSVMWGNCWKNLWNLHNLLETDFMY